MTREATIGQAAAQANGVALARTPTSPTLEAHFTGRDEAHLAHAKVPNSWRNPSSNPGFSRVSASVER
jgi:hypothetical protein